MTYAPAKFEVAKSNGLGGDAFTRKEKTLFDLDHVAKYPLHHVAYAPAKFEVATTNR